MPGLVAGRFPTHEPARAARRCRWRSSSETLPEGDVQLQEERRLFYVGDDPGARRAGPDARRGLRRRRRPAALAVRARGARPAAAGGRARAPARPRRPLERIAAAQPADAEPAPARVAARSTSRCLLSFYAIDDYLSCPLKYKYGHVLRVPVAPHHALIYGSALHKAVQEFHRRQARGDVMTDEELGRRVRAAWTNEGFLTREHEEARLAPAASAPPVPRGAAQAGRGRSRPTSSASSASASTATGSAAAGTGSTSSRPTTAARRGRRTAPRRAPRRHRRADARPDRPRAGHDHRLQVERRPRPGQGPPARPRLAPAPDLRDGLRGADRPPAGLPPAPLPRLGPRRAGSRSTRSAWRRPARRSRPRPPGSGPATTRRSRTGSTCGYCPFREICPSSVAT